ncbi:unnamed protein product [Dibothriocephalus latus]|uniref:Uncharacterized protein n=1 Tax=Dibothriocephalus latus TaxID=60516 RepID=A0A3P6QGF3_DIBLA|nr:unnamed protein product [Dibothriocephalus latus]
MMVSAASAVAMAIRLTYLNLKANEGVLPSDADLFQPLVDEPVDVPVLPNVTFKFSRDGDTYFDYYDFYFFSLNPRVTIGPFDHVQAPYDEIFRLSSVVVWPLTHLVDVIPKVWPNGSNGPKRNYCLQTGCDEYNYDAFGAEDLIAINLTHCEKISQHFNYPRKLQDRR